jgi:ABC-type glutathione transport system ATPase component
MEARCPRAVTELTPPCAKALFFMAATALLYLGGGILLNVWVNGEASEVFGFLGKGRSGRGAAEKDDTGIMNASVSGSLNPVDDPAAYSVLVQNLSKTYFRDSMPFHALKEVSFNLMRGQVLGLLGPNGAGKTTLLSILTGMIKADGGQAWIGGFNVSTELPEIYKRIGVCPQFDLHWPDLTANDHLLFYARLKGLKQDQSLDTIVQETLSQVKLTEHAHKPSSFLSGGQKRRLSLAIAMIGNPTVVLLDEPTTGLDPFNREGLWKIIEGIKTKTSFIITTHLMQEADYLSDSIGRQLSYLSYHEPWRDYCSRDIHRHQKETWCWALAHSSLPELSRFTKKPKNAIQEFG